MKIYDLKKMQGIAEDERGWMAEISKLAVENEYEIKNIHVGTIAVGQTRGNHVHKKQREWVFILNGKVLFSWKEEGKIMQKEVDSRDSLLFEFEENCPHAFKNIHDEEIYICAFANQEYNSTEPDRFFEKLID